MGLDQVLKCLLGTCGVIVMVAQDDAHEKTGFVCLCAVGVTGDEVAVVGLCLGIAACKLISFAQAQLRACQTVGTICAVTYCSISGNSGCGIFIVEGIVRNAKEIIPVIVCGRIGREQKVECLRDKPSGQGVFGEQAEIGLVFGR